MEPMDETSETTTCAGCQHFERCKWLIARTGEETECDWTPSRYLPAQPHDTEPSP